MSAVAMNASLSVMVSRISWSSSLCGVAIEAGKRAPVVTEPRAVATGLVFSEDSLQKRAGRYRSRFCNDTLSCFQLTHLR